MDGVRRLLSYIPSSNQEQLPIVPTEDSVDRTTPELLEMVPDEERRGYDVRNVIASVFDRESFMEVHRDYAPNVVIGFARLAGRTLGIFANQPNLLATALDINFNDKSVRFIRF